MVRKLYRRASMCARKWREKNEDTEIKKTKA